MDLFLFPPSCHPQNELVGISDKLEFAPIHLLHKHFPVGEQLPEFGKPVLILTDYGKMDVCYLRIKENRLIWYNDMRPEHTNGSVIGWISLEVL